MKTEKLYRGDYYDRSYRVESKFVWAYSMREAKAMLEEMKVLSFYRLKVVKA